MTRLHPSPARRARAVFIFSLVALAVPGSAPAAAALSDDPEPGVYLRLLSGSSLDFEDASRRLEAALSAAGWTVDARLDAAVGQACAFRGRVIVAHLPSLADRLLASGPHAAFALPVRFVVWEDETGVGVGATNPMNLFRTIVDEETSPSDWADVADRIRAVGRAAFPGAAAEGEYGQRRGNARIGRTMGIMAGGPFVGKLKEVVTQPAAGASAASVANRLRDAMVTAGAGEWGIRAVYVIPVPGRDMALLGVTGSGMEERSFSIVRHGGADARKDMACPGVDHAAAYPIEVSVAVVDGELQVRLVDVMYRMKMFFEDAGKMAFAKNMGMPGSIEDEIKDKIRAVLR
ncbi:MAG: hypothetical protein AMXMBFR53_17840 [Gemmatimonadota bacterium]